MTVFSEHEDLRLPELLASQYEIRSCLKYAEQAATYLLRDKQTDRLYLLKTASDPVFAELLVNENKILKHIHQGKENRLTSTFPSPVSLAYYSCHGQCIADESALTQEPGATMYYIRTFIEGKTLEELCEMNYKKPGLPPERALDYLIALTELLNFLHTMNPPLIHRDIKPQNVVIDPEGTCHFIDLGISRFFRPEKRSDTMIMGTKLTAPPEQFGYQQTDMRSDLYSLGILLFYCLTGEYEITDHGLSEFPPQLQHIIRKATMFDPKKRYQSAKELLPDLIMARHGNSFPNKQHLKYQKTLIAGCILLLSSTLALAGISAFQFQKNRLLTAELEQVYSKNAEHTFTESLIEDAVRQQLNNPDGPVTYADLEKITELHIFGLQIYSDDSEIWLRGEYPWFYTTDYEESGLYNRKGTIQSLEDISYMPNLDTLCLYRQQIDDISILKDTKIKHLGLGYNPLTDLSPLAGHPEIEYLSVPCLTIEDASIFGTMPNLSSLNISNTGIKSLDGLENCKISQLNLYQVILSDYSELQKFTQLTDLTLDYVTPDILEQLSDLPITRLDIHNSDVCALEDFSVFPALEYLHFSGTGTETLLIGTPVLSNLTELDLGKVSIEGFSELAGLERLETLSIYGADCTGYDGIDRIPNLRIISCTEAQYLELTERYPEQDFIYTYYS